MEHDEGFIFNMSAQDEFPLTLVKKLEKLGAH